MNRTYELVIPPAPQPEMVLRDKIATIVYEQILVDNKMRDIVCIDEASLKHISKGIAKIAHDFADDFMRERYERMCVKATGINLEDLIKK